MSCGFTGDEHLNAFRIINMNGRLYDPVTTRFFSPDPYVQMPDFTQSFNRYSYCLNNPLMYVDPDGELMLFALTVGAMVMTYQGLVASIENGATGGAKLSYMLGGALIGAVSGVIGAGVGQIVAGSVGTIGFAGGALTGMASGASACFISSAGNSWLNGGSFKDGLFSGLLGGIIGGGMGALAGGISGSIYAKQHGGNLWSGEGATFESTGEHITGNIIEIGEGMEYSNSYAKKFSDKYFGKNIRGVSKLYADGTIPSGYVKNGDLVLNSKGISVRGVTTYLGKGKNNVYLFKSAFTSMEQLYLTMGHEYIHAFFFTSGLMNESKQEAAIRVWEYNQAKIWNFNLNYYADMYNSLIGKFDEFRNYINKIPFSMMYGIPW